MENVIEKPIESTTYCRKLYSTNMKSKGLSTTIPIKIVRKLGLKARQEVIFNLKTIENENIIIIKIPETGELQSAIIPKPEEQELLEKQEQLPQ